MQPVSASHRQQVDPHRPPSRNSFPRATTHMGFPPCASHPMLTVLFPLLLLVYVSQAPHPVRSRRDLALPARQHL